MPKNLERQSKHVVVVNSSSAPITINDGGGSITVDGPLTDTQLRATPVPISGTVTATVSGGSGTSMIDDAAFTVGTTAFNPSGGTYKSVRDTVDDGDGGAFAMNAKRGMFATLETSASVETGVAANPLQVSLANHAANATAVKVDGSAVTQPVSGTFFQVTQPVSGTVAATQSGTWTVQPGNTANTTAWKVDGSAVAQPVTDNSGSLTVDQPTGTNLHMVVDSGTVTTVSTVTNLAQQGGVAISLNTGVRDTGTQRVTIATNDVVPVTDNSGSLTVDYATTGSGTATGALRVELPTNGTGVIATVGAVTAITNALPAGSNVIGALTANQSVNTAQVNAVTVLTGTGATGTGSQRVTVAVDSATVAGSASLPAGTNAIGKLAANSGVIIGDVNVVSLIPGVAATSLGKAEDAAHTTGDTGVMMFAVRNNNGATTFTDTNLDYSPISVSANGSLYLGSVIPGTTATELGKAEDQASAGGDVGVLAMAMRRDTPVANDNTNADGDYTQIKLDNLGKLWTAQTQTEDAAHTSGDRGSFILGVRNTANTTLAGTDGDYAPIAVDIMSGPVSGVRRQSTILTAINTTYDDSPTTATSASVDCSMFRRGSFNAIVTESGTATDITFTLQFSNDGGTTWFDYRVGPWVKYRFDDATIAAHASNQLKICEPFECVAPNVRMIVTGVGTDASNSFTVANATFELVN